MNWFKAIAPIRLKLLCAFGSMTMITLLTASAAALAPLLVSILCILVGTALTAALGFWYRAAIADPYVATVVRMEHLAAGDLTSPIHFTHFQDCVGRLTKAMFTFRDAASSQIEQTAIQRAVVATLAERLSRVADGDLLAQVAEDFPTEYALLKTNFNDALASLRSLIGAVGGSTDAIRTGSSEIAAASENLARRTENNAASLERTSAALVEMDGRLKASASASTSTVARADEAIATVGDGRAVAEQAVQAMGRVSDSAKGIDSVIEGLDKIAFQTRVLAMNAAVEAGRAGDAGRGFAVVADLVSALAMRAEEEAKRARDQLTVTQTEIVTAVEAVEKVDGALATISSNVGEVHKLLEVMAADNEAQSAAITEISTAVGTMDQSTQENAAMVEETSAAARNLTAEVASLTAQAAAFKIEADTPRRRPAPAAVAPQPAPPARAYVSPVKPLPAKVKSPVKAKANGHANGHDSENWSAF